MTDEILSLEWDRIPSVEGLASRISEMLDELDILYLGNGSDGVPLFAFSRKGQQGETALVIAGGAGDSITGLPAAFDLLTTVQPLEDFTTWVICGLDAPRLRHNDVQLGMIKPGLSDYVGARRAPWGPGEDPEQGMPINYAQLRQYDSYEGQVLQCTPEALALARAVRSLQPSLVVSLRDQAAGAATITSSQELPPEEWGRLCDLSIDLNMYAGPRVSSGHTVSEVPGCTVLHSIDEEARRYQSPDKLALGPVGIWQFMQSENPDALYLCLSLPRFYSPALSDLSLSDQLRSVEVSHENRLLRGREQMTRVVRLSSPGHPADGAELRVERGVDPEEEVGLLEGQPAVGGWLAVEAMLLRRAALSQALEVWQDALEHLEGEERERGMQVLMAASQLDAQIKAAQTNKRFGGLATRADWAYWSSIYPIETALILSESLRCLRGENKADPRVNQLRDSLGDIISIQLEGIAGVEPVDAQGLARCARDWVQVAASVATSEGTARTRAQRAVEELEKKVAEARRESRSARHLRLSAAEKSMADRRLSAAQTELEKAQHNLAILRMRSEEKPEPAVQPDGQKPKTMPRGEDRPERLPEAHVAEEAPADGHPSVVEPDPPPPLPEPPEPDPPALETGPGPEDAVEVAPVDAPAAEPQIVAHQPETWFLGPDKGRVELDADLDIEPMLPDKLEIPAEWGRGPLRWKDQVPARSQQPMLRRLARHLVNHDPVEASGVEAEAEVPSVAIAETQGNTVAVREARSTGWLKKRTELPGRYKLKSVDPPDLPSAPEGRWREAKRRL